MLGNKSLIIFGLAAISLIRLIKVALEGEKKQISNSIVHSQLLTDINH